MTEAFICDAIRTPIGRYGGTLAAVRPDDLGDGWGRVIPAGAWREGPEALERADVFMIKCSPEAWESLRGLGVWMQMYGEAIYGTRICAPYRSRNLAFTRKGDVVYVIRLYPEEREAVEEKLLISYQGKIRGISMVDTKKEADWKMTEEGIQVVIPQEYREGETPIAIVWKIEQ